MDSDLPASESGAKPTVRAKRDRPVDASEVSTPEEAFEYLAFHQESFSGPLPRPQDLAHYQKVFDGCAERIVAMAEGQAAHRQGLERKRLEGAQRLERWGQILGFTLAMTICLGGIYLLAQGREITGLVALLTPIAILVGQFLYTRRRERKQQEQRESRLAAITEALKKLDADRSS